MGYIDCMKFLAAGKLSWRSIGLGIAFFIVLWQVFDSLALRIDTQPRIQTRHVCWACSTGRLPVAPSKLAVVAGDKTWTAPSGMQDFKEKLMSAYVIANYNITNYKIFRIIVKYWYSLVI